MFLLLVAVGCSTGDDSSDATTFLTSGVSSIGSSPDTNADADNGDDETDTGGAPECDGSGVYESCFDASDCCGYGTAQTRTCVNLNDYGVCGVECDGDASGCPPPPGGSTAIPECYGGSCVLRCPGDTTCPPGQLCYYYCYP
jgi:hypothetical protein